ncbi:protein of unknown function [Spirosomataceae bacterium TFI 002]|nr:protein of unknown function [Spirosomataceae bacterium TFI 002]
MLNTNIKPLIITLFVIATLSFSCNSQENKSDVKTIPVSISGTIKSDYPKKVFLERMNERNIASKIDSAVINPDKTFTLNSGIPEPGIYQVNFDNQQVIGLLLDGNEKLFITADGENMEGQPAAFNVEGSPNMMKFNAVVQEMNVFNQQKTEMEQRFQTAKEKEKEAIRKEFQTANDAFRNKIKPMISEMGTSMGGIIAANNFLVPELDGEYLDILAQKLKAEKKDHYYAKLFLDTMERKSAGKEGSMAPDFELTTLQGEKVKLSDLRGKKVIIDFWATWCGPCIMSFPGMKKAQEKYASNPDVQFLFINTFERVSPEQWQGHVASFVEKRQFQYLNPVLDIGNGTAMNYGVEGIPAKFCVGPDGKIIHKSTGYLGSSDAVYKEMVEWIDGAK